MMTDRPSNTSPYSLQGPLCRPLVLSSLASALLFLLSAIVNFSVGSDDDGVFFVRIVLLSICTLAVAGLGLIYSHCTLLNCTKALVKASMLAINLVLYLTIDARFLDNFFEVNVEGPPPYLGVLLVSATAYGLMPSWVVVVFNSCYLGGYLAIHASNHLDARVELIEIALVEIIFILQVLKRQEYSIEHELSVLDQPSDTEEDAPFQLSVLEEIGCKLSSAISGLRHFKRHSEAIVQPLTEIVRTLLDAKAQLKVTAQGYSFIPKDNNPNDYQALTTMAHVSDTRPRIQRPRSLANLDAFMNYEFEDLVGALTQLGKNWNIDMFFIARLTSDKPLQVCGKYFLTKYRLHEIFNISEAVFSNFFETLEAMYHSNPYHNSCHAADVLNSTVFLINQSDLRDATSDLELLALIVAALAHDVSHPGFTNRYLVNTRDSLAIQCKR